MTNTSKLRALFIENNLTSEDVSKKLKISKQSLSMKMNNKREFKASEIDKLVSLFNILNIEDLKTIFFVNDVELKSTGKTL